MQCRPKFAKLNEILRSNILTFEDVVRKLSIREHVVIIGGVARYLDGREKAERVGDLDIVINNRVAKSYWAFATELINAGYRPVYDVLQIENYVNVKWEALNQRYYAHAKAFRLANYADEAYGKYPNLDVIMSLNELRLIKGSKRWVYLIEKCNREPTEDQIRRSHKYLQKQLPPKGFIEDVFRNKSYSEELKLCYHPTEKKCPPPYPMIRCYENV